jgi:uncharacterized protein YndB with AHSA1/START domain
MATTEVQDHTDSTTPDIEPELIVTHLVDAPRDRVFQAWTNEERLGEWWGPAGLEMLSCKIDLRPGGLFHYGMGVPNGPTMWGRWVFGEITPPERLEFIASFSNEQAGVTRAPFTADWPLEVLSTVTFVEEDGKTRLTMRGIPVNASDAERQAFAGMRDGMQQGWAGTLGQLDSYLAQPEG